MSIVELKSPETPTGREQEYTALPAIRLSREVREKLERWLTLEIEDALSARSALEERWKECLRQYEGTPEKEIRTVPIEGAPNIEVPVGAIAADSIFAHTIDTIFGVSSYCL